MISETVITVITITIISFIFHYAAALQGQEDCDCFWLKFVLHTSNTYQCVSQTTYSFLPKIENHISYKVDYASSTKMQCLESYYTKKVHQEAIYKSPGF